MRFLSTEQGCIQDLELRGGGGGKLSFLKSWGGGGNAIRECIGVQRGEL